MLYSDLLVVNLGFELYLLHAVHTWCVMSHSRCLMSHTWCKHDVTCGASAVHTRINADKRGASADKRGAVEYAPAAPPPKYLHFAKMFGSTSN